ncbi:hypothetical protein C3Y87_20820 [Carbonactinospora thermoautotrophica]|uniref:hypothetical protein n=1 Tax=Carbonactinospora thermoautotrophica TaxID=1469144 RepID=UPI002270871F|nr:hypothetical protein [Carbonactinospora thermoautotrophica]MCX9193774.1 hypothetical protein [Carbonactinospora thermoautotrophica]
MHPRGSALVGWWMFELEDPVPAGVEGVEYLLGRLSVAAAVLSEASFLVPSKLECRRWKAFKLPVVALPLDGVVEPGPLADQLGAFAAEHGAPEAQPSKLRLSGPGRYFDASGEVHVDDRLCDLEITNYRTHGSILVLSVYSDVWLPYDLTARPQPEVWRRNAPRLEAVLRQLEAAFGVEVEPGEPTKHAEILRYGLDNLRDVRDEVIDTLTW